jgi:hypothetical protein
LFDPETGAINRTTLFKIDWAYEQHGGNQAFTDLSCYGDEGGYLLANPYTNCGSTNYVLSCADCHEPHGSPNNYLIRRWVNNGFNDCPSSQYCAVVKPAKLSVTVTNYGKAAGPDSRANKEWVYLCGKCHTYLNRDGQHTHPTDGESDCFNCHFGGGDDYRNCGECHYHGSTDPDLGVKLF